MLQKFIYCALFSTLSVNGIAQKHSLEKELTRLDINTSIIIQSQAIDEYPMWSSDSKYIAYNEMGTWYKVDLTNLKLIKVTKPDETMSIGIAKEFNKTKLGFLEKIKYKHSSYHHPRKIVVDSFNIEAKMENMITTIILQYQDEKPKTIWNGGMGNCHQLSLSPNQKYLAFICEMTGVIIIKIKKEKN